MSKVIDEIDFSKSIIRGKSLSATNPGNMTTTIEFPGLASLTLDEPVKHGGGGQGPSPLQGVLGSLCGCEAVTFSRTAKEKNFNYNGLEFEAEFTIDIRGRMGVRSVVPHFKTVRVQVYVKTNEDEARLLEVVKETEARCPVFNLIKDAGVEIECVWVRSTQK
ncbi:uncharacterized protein METZ01_LOCUS269228 [marine metagenome]|jgi:uncharacterized OsmC-like protein|uniref:OsmC family protein n=1 Tax=marine metagenome TaxID=408172 RepID=A0A382JV66_9ZZZZ|tara:strand:+ start:134 stop:622 length:489 start_codon:yes stop_codon:yes gene_type:complete